MEVKKKKGKSNSEAVEFLREKAKLDHYFREEELQLRKDQQSQTLVVLQQQKTNESSFTFSDGKNGQEAEKLEQFTLYQFITVRCLLISTLNDCNTVFLFRRSFLILKCLHVSCLVSLAPVEETLSQFRILTP